MTVLLQYESIEYDYGDDHFDETTNIIGAVITVIFFIFLFVSSIAYKRHQTVQFHIKKDIFKSNNSSPNFF